MPTSGLQFHNLGDLNITHYRSPQTRSSGVGIRTTLQVLGLVEVVQRLRNAGHKVHGTVGKLLQAEAVAILQDAKDNYVPVDTGALHDSGFVSKPMFWGSVIAVDVGFGPSRAERAARLGTPPSGSEYAVPVHEMPNIPHERGQWKYLETPAMLALEDIPGKIKTRLIAMFAEGA